MTNEMKILLASRCFIFILMYCYNLRFDICIYVTGQKFKKLF